ncbi:hypothetical protein QBC44DRAFT_330741 [Cladorrhinum sp. PSN332]|nr:hypothetical protein QBC44DRAFT_330741 [Cladorrhinum sp. PSN332]
MGKGNGAHGETERERERKLLSVQRALRFTLALCLLGFQRHIFLLPAFALWYCVGMAQEVFSDDYLWPFLVRFFSSSLSLSLPLSVPLSPAYRCLYQHFFRN